MKKSIATLLIMATVLSACGSGTDNDARNVTIPGRDVLARILPLGITFAPGQTAAVAVAGNRDSTCVIDHQGGLWCWGRSLSLESVGAPDISNVPVRMQIPGGQPVTAVSSGDSGATCAVSAGRVYCWGSNWSRQAIPTNATRFVLAPTLVEGITDVVDVVTTYRSSCARKTDGSVWCWGSYEAYGLGGVAYTNRTIGGPFLMGNLNASKIVGAADTYCVLTAIGAVSCWGWNQRGQTGIGNLLPVLLPTNIRFVEAVIDLSMSDGHSCAVLISGTVQCWGYNSSYQLGNVPTNTYVLNPNFVDLRGDRAMSISVSTYRSCILTSTDAVKCWGQYPGSNNIWWVVSAVSTMTNTMMITSNASTVLCAVQWTGEVRCAGSDYDGALGDGGPNTSSAVGVKVGSFGTAGVAVVPTTSTSVAPVITTSTTVVPTTSTTVAVNSEPTITVAPIPTVVASPTTSSPAADAVTTVPASTTPSTSPTGSSPETTMPAGSSTATPSGGTGGSSGVDAAGNAGVTQVTVPASVAPGAIARVLIIKKGRSVSDATIARFAGVGVPKKAKVNVTIKTSSKKFCARNGAKVTGAKRGTCTLTVKVTPKGQKPRVRVVTAQVVG